jgi:hypothetical protein
MGVARTDNPDRPRIAHIDLDFDLLAGDPTAPAAEEVVRSLSPPFSLVTSSSAWEPLLRRVWGEALQTRIRVAFEPGDWDSGLLRNLQKSVPVGFSLGRIGPDEAARFSRLEDSLVYNFPTLEEFTARGVGFGVEHKGRYVSGCSSFGHQQLQPRIRDPDTPGLSSPGPRLRLCCGNDRILPWAWPSTVLGRTQRHVCGAGYQTRLHRPGAIHGI